MPLWVLIAIAAAAAWLVLLACVLGLLRAAGRAEELSEQIGRCLR